MAALSLLLDDNTSRDPELKNKTIRHLIYEQKLSTQHQIMALCPLHMGIAVDKEIIGRVKFFCC